MSACYHCHLTTDTEECNTTLIAERDDPCPCDQCQRCEDCCTCLRDSLVESIEALRAEDFAAPSGCWGWRQELYLHPEDGKVSLFTCVGSGTPEHAWHHRSAHIVSVPIDAVADSVADALLAHVDAMIEICGTYLGDRWDGNNWIGRWADPGDCYPNELEGILEGIKCAWDIADWIAHDQSDWGDLARSVGVDPERGEDAVAEVADLLVAWAAADGEALKDPTHWLTGAAADWLDGREEVAS